MFQNEKKPGACCLSSSSETTIGQKQTNWQTDRGTNRQVDKQRDQQTLKTARETQIQTLKKLYMKHLSLKRDRNIHALTKLWNKIQILHLKAKQEKKTRTNNNWRKKTKVEWIKIIQKADEFKTEPTHI